MSQHTNFHAPRTSLSGRKVPCGGGGGGWWWVVVVFKPILVFSLGFDQAEQYIICERLFSMEKGLIEWFYIFNLVGSLMENAIGLSC